MTLTDVKTALLSVSTRVYRYTAPATPIFPYIVWAEDMESDNLSGDGRKLGKVIEGTIDVFSKIADDPYIQAIETALNNAEIGHRLNSTQYEPDTKIIHTEWVFDIEMEV